MPKPPKPQHNCFKIFEHATYFHESEHRLRNTVPQDRPDQLPFVAHPCMVLSAFASELYLKSLLCLESGNVPQTHNLKALFRGLSPDAKRRLEKLWEDYNKLPNRQKVLDAIRKLPVGHEVRTDLGYALDVGADAFREIRYIYETGKSFFLLGDFPNLLRQVIVERMPWWASFQPTPPKPL
jgi:hypothetical protein